MNLQIVITITLAFSSAGLAFTFWKTGGRKEFPKHRIGVLPPMKITTEKNK